MACRVAQSLRAKSRLSLRSLLLYNSCRGFCVASSSRGENQASGLRKSSRDAILRNNRRDPELEKLTRQRRLRIPLAEVKREWSKERGPIHLQMAAQHFHLYEDLYGGSEFRPRGFMEIKYSEGGTEVHRGNIIYPNQSAAPPEVVLPRLVSAQNDLWTLVLCNPDGNPMDGTKEILHWMVCNIPSSGVLSDGQTVVPYLPPLPFKGSGIHRMVFTLYHHLNVLPLSHSQPHGSASGSSWIDRRTFSSQDFMSTHSLVPFTFSFFQTLWDESVRCYFSETLATREFVYDLESKPTPRKLKQAQVKYARSQRYRSY